jgi:anti-sigma factor RsiW
VVDHARHDRLRIAAAADRDATPDEVAAAADQLAACPDCARLHADLLTIAAAVSTTTVPPRRRDFTLTPADAEGLRPGGLRRWLQVIGTSRDTITRPLAVGFTTLGLAGLLLASAPALLPAVGGGPVLSAVGNSVKAPAAAPAAGEPDHAGATVDTAGEEETATMSGGDPADGSARQSSRQMGPDPWYVTFAVLSGAFLTTGVGLFALRRVSSRS